MDRLLVRAWNFALIRWTDLTARVCQLAAEFYCSVEFSKFGRFAASPYLHCPEPREHLAARKYGGGKKSLSLRAVNEIPTMQCVGVQEGGAGAGSFH
jgi:hypothetical protein